LRGVGWVVVGICFRLDPHSGQALMAKQIQTVIIQWTTTIASTKSPLELLRNVCGEKGHTRPRGSSKSWKAESPSSQSVKVATG
jgi:hypothetical protein